MIELLSAYSLLIASLAVTVSLRHLRDYQRTRNPLKFVWVSQVAICSLLPRKPHSQEPEEIVSEKILALPILRPRSASTTSIRVLTADTWRRMVTLTLLMKMMRHGWIHIFYLT